MMMQSHSFNGVSLIFGSSTCIATEMSVFESDILSSETKQT